MLNMPGDEFVQYNDRRLPTGDMNFTQLRRLLLDTLRNEVPGISTRDRNTMYFLIEDSTSFNDMVNRLTTYWRTNRLSTDAYNRIIDFAYANADPSSAR